MSNPGKRLLNGRSRVGSSEMLRRVGQKATLKYNTAAMHIALNLRRTELRETDDDLPLEVAPRTTLLSTRTEMRTGRPILQHRCASLSTDASSRILMCASFRKVHEESMVHDPEMARSFTPIFARPLDEGTDSSRIRSLSLRLHAWKSPAMAAAN